MADTYDLTTDIGKVRLKIADTNTASFIFTDAEIQVFIDESGDLHNAAAMALYANAADSGRLATRKTAGNYTEDLTAIAKELRTLAEKYFELSQYGAVDTYSEMDWTGRGEADYRQRILNKYIRGES